jgi:hypothetical protein
MSAEQFPTIHNRIEPPRWFALPAQYNGEYYFGDSASGNYAMANLWSDNPTNRWAVVGTYDPPICVPGVLQPDLKCFPEPQKFMTPISSMWLSRCGRYILHPDEQDPFPASDIAFGEDHFFGKWLPQNTWKEYYTYAATTRFRYCYNNRKFHCRS